MGPYMWDGGGAWWVLMLVGMLLFWVAVGVGFYLLFRVLAQRGPSPLPLPVADTPRAILDRRLAAGEITLDEYQTLRATLEQP